MTTSDAQSAVAAPKHRILVIDDEPMLGMACKRALAGDGHAVEAYADPKEGLQAALLGGFDVMFVDLMMPDISGLEILRHVKSAGVQSEVIIITGNASVETAVDAMKHGAADYLSKPFTPQQLKLVLQKVLERSELIRENTALRRELESRQGFEGIIGGSAAMEAVFAMIRRVAPTDGTVLVMGESGTGKEMIVQAIHRLSRRHGAPLLACDCSALAPSLLESELFGHVKGSFSGAIATKQGLFEVAHNGTLFLDEVSNLSLETQGKLLRVLETKKVKKVGDTTEREIDIRLVAAANRDLLELVRDGAFREDLYYRLNVVPIHLPPLRKRRDDIPLLLDHFLRASNKRNEKSLRMSREFLDFLTEYNWPGNVRELQNLVERLVILTASDVLRVEDLPDYMVHPEIGNIPPALRPAVPLAVTQPPVQPMSQGQPRKSLRDLEREQVESALIRNGWVQSRAARELGLTQRQMGYRIKKFALQCP